MVGQREETKPLPGFQLGNWGMTMLLPEEEATGYREEARGVARRENRGF